MWTQDMDRLLYGAQFMTEKIGGSDAGAAELTAVRIGGFTAKSGSAPTLTATWQCCWPGRRARKRVAAGSASS